MRQFNYIGRLPPGDWKFCLVEIEDQEDAIIVVDMTGQCPPRMIVNGKLVELP